MKGATAELSVNIINRPSNINTIIMGASHHFFLIFRKSHNSFNIASLPILLVLPF